MNVYLNNLKHWFWKRRRPEFKPNEVGAEAAKRNKFNDAGGLKFSSCPTPSKIHASGGLGISPYVTLFLVRAKTLWQYRAAALAGVATQFFWGLISVMVYRAFYTSVSSAEPLSLSQTLTFVWIGQALLSLIPWSLDKEIAAQVQKGHIAYELVRPLSLYTVWWVRSCALRAIPTLMRALPIFVIGGWLGLQAPASAWSAGCFVLSLLGALLLAATTTTTLLISLFWTLSAEGIQRLLPYVTLLLSGITVPIPLFPDWLQPFMRVQPFRGVVDIPCRFYTGVIAPSQALYYLGFQLVWAVSFFLFGRWLLHRAMQRVIIQGG